MLPTANREWGFYGTAALDSDDPNFKVDPDAAFEAIRRRAPSAEGFLHGSPVETDEQIREFLDSRYGRRFADYVIGEMRSGKGLQESIDSIRPWQKPGGADVTVLLAGSGPEQAKTREQLRAALDNIQSNVSHSPGSAVRMPTQYENLELGAEESGRTPVYFRGAPIGQIWKDPGGGYGHVFVPMVDFSDDEMDAVDAASG